MYKEANTNIGCWHCSSAEPSHSRLMGQSGLRMLLALECQHTWAVCGLIH